MPMPVLAAFGLSTARDESTLSPRDRVLRDLYWLHQAANSPGRQALEPLVVTALTDGWRHVLEHQSFALSMPMRCAPAIDTAIKAMEQSGIRAGSQLIDAVAGGCRVDISRQWKLFLDLLAGKGSTNDPA
jgi:hypothetical protein